jgi:thioredoxin-like negative regulator of GroEL
VLVLAIKNGKEINRFTGIIDEDRIETILDELNR